MSDLNYLAIGAAAVAVFVVSSAWYAVFGGQLAALHDAYAESRRSAAATVVVELVRNLVLAAVVAWLAEAIGIEGWVGVVGFALLLWVGFPVVLLAGSVFHENVPWKLAAIHAGDWLLKIVIISIIVVVWA